MSKNIPLHLMKFCRHVFFCLCDGEISSMLVLVRWHNAASVCVIKFVLIKLRVI